MRKYLTIILLPALLLCSCSRLQPVLEAEREYLGEDPCPHIDGFYLLNEGNMGSNKCSLDYYDYAKGEYQRNIFPSRNPSVVRELGDVGNDIAIYGGKLYITLNCSHLVEVMDARTASHIASIPVPNCRSLAFAGPYAYVSSYAGEIEIDPHYRKGYVARIDTLTLRIDAECAVGYQPEEMMIKGDMLYVANSGGYMAPDYDSTVSVIDLTSFELARTLDVAINLQHIAGGSSDRIWLTSRGDYATQKEKVVVLEGESLVWEKTLPCSAMAIARGKVYLMGKNGSGASYVCLDEASGEMIDECFVSEEIFGSIQTPYGLAVNPVNGDILIGDATDYVTPGRLYCLREDGTLKWTVMTGDIPGHFAFRNSFVYL